MLCCVAECGREAQYKGKQLCQKHYFRLWRNGHYEKLPTSRQIRRPNAKGYVALFEPTHPLAMKDGYVYEHRKVVFARYGDNLPPCEICGAPTNWATCHIDHRDEVVTNNEQANLRPLCRGCNTSRTERVTTVKYTHAGLTMTLAQWAEHPGVTVGYARLRGRVKSDMPIEEALFAPNKTHPKRSAALKKELEPA